MESFRYSSFEMKFSRQFDSFFENQVRDGKLNSKKINEEDEARINIMSKYFNKSLDKNVRKELPNKNADVD